MGLVHFRDRRSEQVELVDQPVTTLGNNEALVKVASHQGFLSGCCETTANKGGEPRNWPNSWPLREARRGKRMTGHSPSKTHCIDRS